MNMHDVVVGVLAIMGATFILLAGVGVVRFPDLYARMHAATKASTIGIALVGTAGAITIDGGAAKIVLATAIIFVTAPSAAHFIGRASYRADGTTVRLDGPDDLHDLMRSEEDA
jgi:multicomponent Na+:H+ antiporter subunit G